MKSQLSLFNSSAELMDHLPRNAEEFVFILLEFLFHLCCPCGSVHIFALPCALIRPVSHLQTLLAAHMLFVGLPGWKNMNKRFQKSDARWQIGYLLFQLHFLISMNSLINHTCFGRCFLKHSTKKWSIVNWQWTWMLASYKLTTTA